MQYYYCSFNDHFWILVIKGQIITANDIKNLERSSLKFPDEDDIELIDESFNGMKAQILIPNELLNKALSSTSKIYWLWFKILMCT